MNLINAVANIFDLINLLLFISIVLTWIPNINWNNQPFLFLRNFSEIFFAPFRKIIPPLGMIDISPIAALFCLLLLRNLVIRVLIFIF